ncbi:MAG: PIN domain-containing protein [Nitrospirae bacterium]|nr:MAG: PIN domain-containing protein [Nitrospirota bacterium]
MIALDTNILVYAHREDSPWYDRAYQCVVDCAQGRSAWAIPWPCLYEFLAIVTHPRIYDPPTPLSKAIDQLDAWLESPSLTVLAEPEHFSYWQMLRALLNKSRVMGPQIHDARIVALCCIHGIRELWTADRGFGRFPELRTRNPLMYPSIPS